MDEELRKINRLMLAYLVLFIVSVVGVIFGLILRLTNHSEQGNFIIFVSGFFMLYGIFEIYHNYHNNKKHGEVLNSEDE